MRADKPSAILGSVNPADEERLRQEGWVLYEGQPYPANAVDDGEPIESPAYYAVHHALQGVVAEGYVPDIADEIVWPLMYALDRLGFEVRWRGAVVAS